MTRTIRKVMAYITRGTDLLIFRQPDFPEAGLQVPGGTLEDGESPEVAVMREAIEERSESVGGARGVMIEETGLAGLRLVSALGEQVRDMVEADRGEIHHRYFFHLVVDDAPDAWRWYETAPFEGQAVEPIAFDLFFVPLANVPPLITEHDYFVAALRSRSGRPLT